MRRWSSQFKQNLSAHALNDALNDACIDDLLRAAHCLWRWHTLTLTRSDRSRVTSSSIGTWCSSYEWKQRQLLEKSSPQHHQMATVQRIRSGWNKNKAVQCIGQLPCPFLSSVPLCPPSFWRPGIVASSSSLASSAKTSAFSGSFEAIVSDRETKCHSVAYTQKQTRSDHCVEHRSYCTHPKGSRRTNSCQN